MSCVSIPEYPERELPDCSNKLHGQLRLLFGVCIIDQIRFLVGSTLLNSGEGLTFMTPKPTDWYHLAEQASKEPDRDKLMSLVNELNRALDQNERTSWRLQTQEPF